MNRTKVVKAIAMSRAVKAGKIPGHAYSPDSEMDYLYNGVEALEEIASQDNIEALRVAIAVLSRNESAVFAEKVAKLRGLLISVQVPKEVVYAYPVTMGRHFAHYSDKWYADNSKVDVEVYLTTNTKDGFGCEWHHFTGPKELVEYLRENNVPIKVIE